MGLLDKAKQVANKENLDKVKKQTQEKLDQVQDKINDKAKPAEDTSKPASEGEAQRP